MKIVVHGDLYDEDRFNKIPKKQIQVKELKIFPLKPNNLVLLDKLLKDFVLPLRSLSIDLVGSEE